MKTLADILRESREEIERHGKVIDKLIAESKEAGVEWPEVVDLTEGRYYYIVDTSGHDFYLNQLVKLTGKFDYGSQLHCCQDDKGHSQAVRTDQLSIDPKRDD